jgi:hypothetical protein
MSGRGSVRVLLAAALILGAALVVGSGCNQPEMSGGWAATEIRVDGNLDDWRGEWPWYDDLRASVGARNDDHFFYLMIRTPDPELLRRAIGQGLTVWIDPHGGKDKVLGIRYPLGLRDMRAPADSGGGPPEAALLPGAPADSETQRTRHGARRRFDPEAVLKAMSESPVEVRLLRESSVSQRLTLDKTGGVEVALGSSAGSFAYELMVPLTAPGTAEGAMDPAHFAIPARPGGTIGVGIEIAAPPRPQQARGRRLEPGEGGEGGRGGEGGWGGEGGHGGWGPGRRGERGGPEGYGGRMPDRGGGRDRLQPIHLWGKVKLAPRPA